MAAASSSASPDLAIITGSSTTGPSYPASAAATASTVAASPSMPILIASGGMSSSTAAICPVTISGGTDVTPKTPRVFCAVIAVMADVP